MSDCTQNTIDQEMSCYKTLGSLDQYDIVTTNQISDVISCIREDLFSKIDTDLAHKLFVHMSGDVDVGTISISGELSVAKDVKVKGNFYALDNVLRAEHLEEQDSAPSGNLVVAEADYIDLNAHGSKIAVDDGLVQISAGCIQLCAENAVEAHSPILEADKDISAANDIYATKHGLVGKDVDFSESGPETFAVGHEHHFFGKESFIAGNEGNVVGAKGFYWKAIDTTNHKIYLTTQRLTRYPGIVASQGSEKQWYTSDHSYDKPYFGPRENSALSTGDNDLFTAEDGINLAENDVISNGKTIVEGVKGKFITIWNCKYANYIRCFKALHVISGSIIEYEDLGTISPNDYKTYYRDKTRDPNRPYTDNQYVMFFPEMDQAKISCDPSSYVRATTFGAAAIGESNTSLGYNSFAAGFTNRAEGHYSMSFGSYNKAQGYNSFAAGSNSVVRSNNAFGWSGNGQYDISGNERAGTFNIKPQNGINGFWIGEHPLGYYLSSLSGNLNTGIDRKLDKYDGGTVSAEVEILSSLIVRNSDVNILSGNYYQSNAASLSVKNYSYKNSFLQAECVYEVEGKHKEWGIACTGSKGYCILSVIPNLSAIKLSGDDLSEIATTPNMLSSFSWALGSTGNCQTLSIQTVDSSTGIVTLKHAIPDDLKAETSALTSETQYIDKFDTDDNAFYCPGNPSIGNIIIHNFYAQHAEGGCVKAIGKYTHAEGRATIADMRYSHAEGDRTIAGRMAAHAEGQESKAYGLYSHAEGKATFVSHNATAAHAEGYKSEATADGAHAEGGIQSSNIKGGTASGKASHAEGYVTQAKSLASHAEGRESIANSNYSHVEGYNTKAGNASGYEDENGEGAHAEGSSSEANGKGAHAEGISTKATGNGAHAEGYYTEANNVGSHAAGFKAKASANYSWCWNGINSTSDYTATNAGSFCINPIGSIDGFWIGNHPLSYYLSSLSGDIDDEIDIKLQGYVPKTSLKSSLSDLPQVENINASSQIDDVISAVVKIRDMLSSLYILAQ